MRARHPRSMPAGRSQQRGVISIIVGLTMAVMVGFVGLALDGGRMYLTKTELQNATDACALAASYQLTGTSITTAQFDQATAAGKYMATRNKVAFQGTAIRDTDVTVEYKDDLAASGWLAAGAASPTSKYVRCRIPQPVEPYFMRALNAVVPGGIPDSVTVSALATATLAPSQSNCAVPMAFCVRPGGTALNNYGYTVNDWYGMDFSQSGASDANYTGNFRWIDFDPGNPTPGCSGGGAQEIKCVMQGTGQCSLPAPITGSCSTSGNASPTTGCVGQNGAVTSMREAYNSRFGLYATGGGPGSPTLTNAPPDDTGYGYSTENWTLLRNAYGGSVGGGILNFRDARTAHIPASNPAGVNPAFYSNPYNPSTVAQHQTYGADRRLVTLPIVDCAAGFTGGQHAPIRAYACALLLDPYRKQGNDVKSRLEYLGLSNAPGSPCSTSGIAGSTTSQGPMVPALVQ